ncbi:hypothetical protein B566_EDAN005486 [Ephemera danica]|nr:hypothetical protein B566_EDAN005486 [Ephemera danica]
MIEGVINRWKGEEYVPLDGGLEKYSEVMERPYDLEEEKVRELQQAVQKQKDIINKHNRELHAKQARIETLAKEAGEHDLNLKKLHNTKERVSEESKAATALVTHMLAKYEWIQQERRLFNQPDTNYDFDNLPLDNMKEKLNAIEARKKTLEKKTNTQAVHILTKAEEQLKDLLKKKAVVEKDRQQLQHVINELDKKMVEVLQQAWQQINKDFGSIFSSLLSGAEAKLVAANASGNVLDGLEVKVGFNGKWKESLGELSGGQRSLVALSLILAMLLFKPAPIYILDEVDAALDPSHTENIGNIIQSHFKQSQFIIVSLKEGMFNNANVLFRTKFVDGMSTVSRNEQKQK